LADHGEKFALATFYARGFKTHLEHAIRVPNSIGYHGSKTFSLPGETHANPEAIICSTTSHLPLGIDDLSEL
jgi:hypothetical protein